ncbi:hypothetical protein QA646_29020 (plasmid) [Rhizobium sp. CB3090]|uniref:hypothetical protein n=1 Tax=Rhizobium sp. CB3090 TaxID=3039156 RepID=UPI0024B05C36|nr:hypothetical protein [Rhizobium sp. CB3090]WFU12927.1 hypothetical protein QA646_29020 [Rhizobium sp. CB3090]
MKRLDESDAEDDKCGSDRGNSGGSDNKLAEKIVTIRDKRDWYKALLEKLNRTGDEQISLTDPDSRRMAKARHHLVFPLHTSGSSRLERLDDGRLMYGHQSAGRNRLRRLDPFKNGGTKAREYSIRPVWLIEAGHHPTTPQLARAFMCTLVLNNQHSPLLPFAN